MRVVLLFAAVSAVLQAPTSYSLADMPAVPKISCQISLPGWCITFGVGKIEMRDNNGQREWLLLDPEGMKSGPLVIVESRPNCANGEDLYVRKMQDRKETTYEVIKFKLTKEDDCYLEFHIPGGEKIAGPSYRQIMLYGILVGGRQLYSAIDDSGVHPGMSSSQ